jgi:hypothetical protein
MPWLEENGLLPGLAIGRGIPMPWLDENGLLPGLGVPVKGVGAGFASGSAAAAAVAAGFSGSAGFGATGASLAGASGLAAFGAAGFAFAFASGSFLAGFSFLGKAARSFSATGGVMVEEPPLTYSPSSSSLAKATLVSIPTSLAMSYTRGSATCFLLFGAYPNREGLSSERVSFRVTHFLSAIFSA